VFSCSSWTCEPTLRKHPNHTILAYGQWEKIWSMLSSALQASGAGVRMVLQPMPSPPIWSPKPIS
jgi:hypothetical protein